MKKQCNHNDKFHIEKNFIVAGCGRRFLQSVSFSMCAYCGEMSDLEQVVIKKNKKQEDKK